MKYKNWFPNSDKGWRNDPDVLSMSPECDFSTQYRPVENPSLRQLYHRAMLKAASYTPAFQHAAVSIGCFGLILVLFTSFFASFHAPISQALAIPPTPTINVCGVRQASDIEQYSGPTLPSSFNGSDPENTARASYRAIDNSPNGGMDSFQFVPAAGSHSDEFYVKVGATMNIYQASNVHLLQSFTLPSSVSGVASFGVEPVSGDVFLATQLNGVYRINSSGVQVWTKPSSAPLDLTHGYVYKTGGQIRFASPTRGGGSDVWDAAGNYLGKNIVNGNASQDVMSGDIVSTTGGDATIYSSDGMSTTFTMQNSSLGGYSLVASGSVQEIDSNTFVVLDNNGLTLFDKTGQFLGSVGDDPGANATGNIETTITGSNMALYNGTLYYQSGVRYGTPEHLSAISVTNLRLIANATTSYPLGVGAGPYTTGSVAGSNYFKPGVSPSVSIAFAPWWAAVASQYIGHYTIRSAAQVQSNQPGTAQSFTFSGDGTNNTVVPVTLPTTDPGYYEMDVRLAKNGTTTGATCMDFSIGASGQTVFENNKPSDEAGIIADAHDLGQQIVRAGPELTIDNFIPNGDASSTAPMVFPASTDSMVQAAAAEASATSVTFEIQVANGSALDKALISNGKWQSRVQEFVAHFKPYIHNWESWNEPNNTYSGDPAAWTNNILKPFYTAVKTADPTATVVGGGILNVSSSYWSGVAAAGGLDYMDVAGIHTYTGHNRSFEEQDQINQLQAVKAVFAANGHTTMPIWDTESGFWQNGPASFWSQGDKLIRKQVLEESIGITKLANFQNLSCYYENSSVLWGNLCNGSLSTGGLAGAQFAAETNGRTFDHWITTNIPHTYAAVYGPKSGDTGSVAVVWADDYKLNVVPLYNFDHATTAIDEYGKTTSYAEYSTVPISGSVTYFAIPAGQTMTLTAGETYGSNVALASLGVTASASSSTSDNPVSTINDGVANMGGHGNNSDGGVSVWFQDPSDNSPSVTLTFPSPTTINRVWLASQGINSVQTGLRSFDVQVDSGNGTFVDAGSVTDSFFDHNHLLSFQAQPVKQLRITNLAINYSGYGNGLPPSFWNSGFSNQATIYEVEAYAPGTVYGPPTTPPPATTTLPVTTPPPTTTPPVTTPVPPTQPVVTTPTTTQSTAAPTVSTSQGSAFNTDSSTTTPAVKSTVTPSHTAHAVAAASSAQSTNNSDTTTTAEPKPAAKSNDDGVVPRPSAAESAAIAAPTNNAQSIKARKVKVVIAISATAGLSVVCLFVGFELWRHRRFSSKIRITSNITPSGGVVIG